jgi:predicted MFS family arabinose efflux permease
VPLLAILTLGATPVQMGLLSALAGLPVLLFGLVAGVWVDRLRRRPILIAADLGRAAVLATIPAAALLGLLHMTQLYIVIVIAGLLGVLFQVAYRAYLPTLVERRDLVDANSKLTFTSSATEIVGPGLTGVLVQTITAPIAMLIDALSFVVSAVSIAIIHKPEPPTLAVADRQPAFQEMVEGLRVVFRDPVLRALALVVATLEFFGSFYAVLYSLYAIRELGLGAALLGLTIGMGGAGSVIGALLAGRAVGRFGLGRTLTGSLLLSTLTGLLIVVARGPVWVATGILMASQLVGDCARTVYFINETSLRQAIVPDRLLGRVSASTQLMGAGLGPLGALLAGVLGQAVGSRATLLIASLGMVLSVLWLVASPVKRLEVGDWQLEVGD